MAVDWEWRDMGHSEGGGIGFRWHRSSETWQNLPNPNVCGSQLTSTILTFTLYPLRPPSAYVYGFTRNTLCRIGYTCCHRSITVGMVICVGFT